MKQAMRNNWYLLGREINLFCQTTTIHGFSYLAEGKNLVSRLIWSFLLVSSLFMAVKMISNTIVDTRRNPISTTIDTVDIKKVPFPAVTLYPGNFRNEKALLRRFYDYIDIERYHEYDPMWNNSDFSTYLAPVLKQSTGKSSWFYALITNSMRKIEEDDVKSKRGSLYEKNRKTVKKSAEILAAIERKDKTTGKRLKKRIENAILENMFKFKGYKNVLTHWINNILCVILENAKATNNITEEEINFSNPEIIKIRKQHELLLLTPPPTQKKKKKKI